jgi:antitoxin (DNA-binding transcriptional repressor) of toxin-antitoxin stability system
MHQVNVAEAEHDLTRLLDEALAGEEVVITRDDRPLIRFAIVPLPGLTRRIGGAIGLVKHMADDFDAPLEDFGPYMP